MLSPGHSRRLADVLRRHTTTRKKQGHDACLAEVTQDTVAKSLRAFKSARCRDGVMVPARRCSRPRVARDTTRGRPGTPLAGHKCRRGQTLRRADTRAASMPPRPMGRRRWSGSGASVTFGRRLSRCEPGCDAGTLAVQVARPSPTSPLRCRCQTTRSRDACAGGGGGEPPHRPSRSARGDLAPPVDQCETCYGTNASLFYPSTRRSLFLPYDALLVAMYVSTIAPRVA